jgi:hypothetical protein
MFGMISLSVRVPLFAFLLGLVVASGCFPALPNRAAGNAIPKPGLVAMPPQVIVYSLDATNHRSFEEPSASVVTQAEGALRAIIDPQGLRFAGRDALVACGISCSAVRESLDADFALFVVLKQARESTGREVLAALGGVRTVGKQIDAACVADLHDGRMVWCMSMRDDRGDIEYAGRMPLVLWTLLHDLFVPSPSP